MTNIRKPEMQEILNYIAVTLKSDHINVTMPIIQKTLKKESGNECVEKYYVEGHFKAINYALSLAGSPDFPVKDLNVLDNEYSAHTALYWLRELHTHMMYPVANFGVYNGTGTLYIQPNQVGVYRYVPKALAFTIAPAPELIPKILYKWLKEIAELNEEVKDKIDNPYGLTPEQSNKIFKKVKDTNLLLASLMPFPEANNLVAKMVENILRLKFRLPWRTIFEMEKDTYIRDLTKYQEDPNGLLKWLK